MLVARRDARDGDLAAPAAELDDERDVGADGHVDEGERAVGRGLRRHQRLAGHLAAALAALHAGRERRHGGVGHVDDRVVDGVGAAVLRERARDDGAGDAGRSALARHLLQAQVGARQRVAAVSVDARAAARVRVLADAALEHAAAAVGGRAAVEAEVGARPRSAERAAVGTEPLASAALAEPRDAADLRLGAGAALEDAAAAVAVGAAGETGLGAAAGGAVRDERVDRGVGEGAIAQGDVARRVGEGLGRQEAGAAAAGVNEEGRHDRAGPDAEQAPRGATRDGSHALIVASTRRFPSRVRGGSCGSADGAHGGHRGGPSAFRCDEGLASRLVWAKP